MKRTHTRTGRYALALLAAAAIPFSLHMWAEKFERAEVTKVVNDVRLLTGTDDLAAGLARLGRQRIDRCPHRTEIAHRIAISGRVGRPARFQ